MHKKPVETGDRNNKKGKMHGSRKQKETFGSLQTEEEGGGVKSHATRNAYARHLQGNTRGSSPP